MNLDERIDEIIGDSFRGLYMLHDDIVTPVDDKYNVLHNFLKQAIKQLIEEEVYTALVKELSQMLDDQIVKPEYHNLIVGKTVGHQAKLKELENK